MAARSSQSCRIGLAVSSLVHLERTTPPVSVAKARATRLVIGAYLSPVSKYPSGEALARAHLSFSPDWPERAG